MIRAFPIATAAVLALAGCGGKDKTEMSAEQVANELSSVQIKPGQWEATNEIVSATAPGMPDEVLKQMTGRKTTVSNCVTPEQAAKPDANFLAAQQNSNCSYEDFSMSGGKMKGKMTCTGGDMPGKMVTTMTGDYGPESYDMTMDMETNLGGEMNMAIKARTTGRRVGECQPAAN